MADAVVLHDAVSYVHPDHAGENRKFLAPGQAPALATALRGQRLSTTDGDFDALPKISEHELKRLEALGAVSTNEKGLDSRLALAGQRPDSRMSPQYASLTSQAEQIGAAKAIAQVAGGSGPQSRKADLALLAIGDLQRLAMAFGATEDVCTSDDKDTVLDFLSGDDGNGEDKAEAAEREQLRDEAQVNARDFTAVEGGKVGTNVTAQGLSAETGLKTERRPSKASQAKPSKS